MLCVFAPVKAEEPKPAAKPYTCESPIDPYDMQSDWLLPVPNYCDYYGIKELDGAIVFACFVVNPDETSEWVTGTIGRAVYESGDLSGIILVFSIVNSDGKMWTYVLKGNNYELIEVRNLNHYRPDGV